MNRAFQIFHSAVMLVATLALPGLVVALTIFGLYAALTSADANWPRLVEWASSLSTGKAAFIAVAGLFGAYIILVLVLFIAPELGDEWRQSKEMFWRSLRRYWKGLKSQPIEAADREPEVPYVPVEGNFFQRNAGYFFTGFCIALAQAGQTFWGDYGRLEVWVVGFSWCFAIGLLGAGMGELVDRRRAAKSRHQQLIQDRSSQSPPLTASLPPAQSKASASEALSSERPYPDR